MKNKKLFLFPLLVMSCLLAMGQSTIPGNTRIPGAFLGWNNAGIVGPLQIRNDFNGANPPQPIDFFTNLTQRMTITPNGLVGIGIANPTANLHINDGIFSTIVQLTNNSTGTLAGDGLRMLVLPNSFAGLDQQENALMFFRVLGAPRQVILPNGNVGIGTNFLAPQSLLHQHVNLAGINFHQWTNLTTGPNLADGFLIGIAGNGNAQLIQQENLPMQFFIFDQNVNINAVTRRAEFTAGGQMPGSVDGFRIWNPGYNLSAPFQAFNSIDIWTGASNTTHLRMDNSGIFEGQNNRFETKARLTGFWFDAQPTSPQHTAGLRSSYIFDIDSVEVMRIGTMGNTPGFPNPGVNQWNVNEGFVRIGLQPQTNIPVVAQNRLEVDAFPNTAFNTPNGNGTGFSGIRLSDLTANSTPWALNPGTGVLSVDTNGDVIYVPSSTGFGALCGGAPFNLAGDWRVGLGGFNLYFDGNGAGNAVNNVIIGKNCVNPLAKLDVLQSSGATSSIGINVVNTGTSTAFPGSAIGLKCSANNLTDIQKIGAWIEAPSAPGLTSTALFIPAMGGKVSIGYAGILNTPDLVEIFGNFNLMGNFNGAGTQNYVSDAQLKTNINPYTHGLDIIRQLNLKTFNYNGLAHTDGSRTQIGVIAQDIAQLNLLSSYAIDTTQLRLNPTDPYLTDILTVNHDAIFFTALNAIKQLDSVVQVQQSLIDSLLGSSSSRINQSNNQTTELSSDVILYQNYPNPFGDETVINYFLPENVSTARMVFYDETGRLVKEEIISNRGNGSVTLKTSNLASGIYSYSLEVNGRSIQTRKMQKVK